MEIKVEAKNDEDKKEQFAQKEIITEEKDKTLEKLYQKDDFQTIQKPPKISSKTLVISIIVSVIFGILLGFFGALFFLKEKLPGFLKF